MTNRSAIRFRVFIVSLGAITSVFGIGFPFIFYLIWGSDSLGIGTAFIWSYLVAPALIFGGVLVYDGVSRPQARHWAYRVSRDIAIVVSLLLCITYAWIMGSVAHVQHIAPRAEVILPDGFQGYFAVILDEYAQPSMGTAGRTYVYEIPNDGVSRSSTGWIAAGSWFANRKSIPKDYSTFWRYRNGDALSSGTFEIDWLNTGSGIGGIVGIVAPIDSMNAWLSSGMLQLGLEHFADSIVASLQH